jgi:hypothetical protein
MNKVSKLVTAAVVVMFAMSVTAAEEAKKKGHMPAFSDFDLDGDGAITEQEFNEGHAKRMAERAAEGHELKNAGKCKFADVDADSDGAISPEEFKAHHAGHMNKGKHMHKGKHKHKHKHKDKAMKETKEKVKMKEEVEEVMEEVKEEVKG